ncbi:hypothetical protein [Plantactinospora sp. B24E8]|uniref:hypothetical protein n=1 Tax=Plantactinospora sp. B24E8 TaxID=3153567 RepID=UPI00325D8A77
MSKSTPARMFGRKSSSSGTVTVIEAKVRRSSARNARLAFVVTAFVVGLLSMAVAADYMHPILAGLLGFAIGTATGAVVWLLVRIWPVIRLIWWWLPEIGLTFGLVYGWISLARHTNLWVRLLVVALVVGVPAAVPVIRRNLIAVAWCVIVRHRLRVCFSQFIIANQSGSLPLILWARPTPVGERVWIYLRPGLSYQDLNTRLDKIAVACHASSVLVERASDRTAAFLRIDVKRREVLTATVGSPLVGLVDPATPASDRTAGPVPTALDLPDVADTPTGPTRPAPSPRSATKPAPAAASASSNGVVADDDVSDWI